MELRTEEFGDFNMTPGHPLYHVGKRVLLVIFLVAGFAAVGPGSAAKAEDRINKTFFGGTAIDGYDPVGYFTMGRAVKGASDITHDWLGARWQFANAEHRKMFMNDPAKYAPQYGGYCAEAVSRGSLFGTDPEAWSIVDGRLYLIYSKNTRSHWEAIRDVAIIKANANWRDMEPKLTN
jgi:hypothetical protein